jgi:hypothetical protein
MAAGRNSSDGAMFLVKLAKIACFNTALFRLSPSLIAKRLTKLGQAFAARTLAFK